MWPYVVPPGLTIWDAAAPEKSQVFMLMGAAITMPPIIGYTAWACWVFRGKVGHEAITEVLPERNDPGETALWKRLAWVVAICTGSVLAVGAVAMVIRFWLKP